MAYCDLIMDTHGGVAASRDESVYENANESVYESVYENLGVDPPVDELRIVDVPLPEGKKFHAFLSHNSERTERAFALELMEILEAAPYKLRCCFADRDFLAGKPVTLSIEERITQSTSAVFLVTPRFLESEFCKHEHLVAQQVVFSREPNFRIIPVLLKDCELPRRLECITYVDARGKTPREIVEDPKGLYYALTNEEYWEEICRKVVPSSTEKSDLNGKFVEIIHDGFNRKKDSNALMKSKFTSREKKGFEKMNLKLNDDDLRMIIRVIKKAPMSVYPYSFSNIRIVSMMFSMSACAVSLFCALWGVVFWARNWDDSEIVSRAYVIAPPFVIPPVVCIIGGLLIHFLAKRKVTEANNEYFGYITQHAYEKKQLLIAQSINPPTKIMFFKYDTTECRTYVANNLLKNVNNDDSEDSTESKTKMIIRRALPGYLDVLREGQLNAVETRHEVHRNLICLCQFVEINSYHIQVANNVPDVSGDYEEV